MAITPQDAQDVVSTTLQTKVEQIEGRLNVFRDRQLQMELTLRTQSWESEKFVIGVGSSESSSLAAPSQTLVTQTHIPATSSNSSPQRIQ